MKTPSIAVTLCSILCVAANCASSFSGSEISEKSSKSSAAAVQVVTSWVNLLPKVVTCYMALAGMLTPPTYH